MKSVNFDLLYKVHNLNCEVCIIFIVHLHLFTYFMNSSSSSSRRRILARVVIMINATKLFFNKDILCTVRNQGRRVN